MKKVAIVMIVVFFFCIGATTKEEAYQTAKNTGKSPIYGQLISDTTDVTLYKVMDLYGVVYTIEIVYTGADADGFTVSLLHLPKKTDGSITFPSRFTKFTKLVVSSGVEYALETQSLNGNIALGSLFTGEMDITVSDFEGTAWFINIITEKSTLPVANVGF